MVGGSDTDELLLAVDEVELLGAGEGDAVGFAFVVER